MFNLEITSSQQLVKQPVFVCDEQIITSTMISLKTIPLLASRLITRPLEGHHGFVYTSILVIKAPVITI